MASRKPAPAATGATGLAAAARKPVASPAGVAAGGAAPAAAGLRKPVAAAGGSAAAVKEVTKKISDMDLAQRVALQRRRLSTTGQSKDDVTTLDGSAQFGEEDHAEDVQQVVDNADGGERKADRPIYSEFYSLSKVGFVPWGTTTKVNQDRACEVAPFGKSKDKAFFGVFDGHGQHGHLVSQAVATSLPKCIIKQKDLDSNPPAALQAAFLDCNASLSMGAIDCSFSGTTGVTVYINGDKIYCANVGDSRAVIARLDDKGQLKALPLSDDHKPDREDERRRILQSGGRVEACRGAGGVEIGPARVWLKTQDVPGLAMTRSFGDLVAASVGVVARPETKDHTFSAEDKMLLMGSDGIWEFITSQEAVNIAAQAKSAEQACRLLVEEAERRWRAEEEVVDDITALVVFF